MTRLLDNVESSELKISELSARLIEKSNELYALKEGKNCRDDGLVFVFTLKDLTGAMGAVPELFTSREFISTVKFVRSLTGLSIKESKDFVEGVFPKS